MCATTLFTYAHNNNMIPTLHFAQIMSTDRLPSQCMRENNSPEREDLILRSIPLRQRRLPASFWQEPNVPRDIQNQKFLQQQQPMQQFTDFSWSGYSNSADFQYKFQSSSPCSCAGCCQSPSFGWAADPGKSRFDPAWMWNSPGPKVSTGFTPYTPIMDTVTVVNPNQAMAWNGTSGNSNTGSANYFPVLHYSSN